MGIHTASAEKRASSFIRHYYWAKWSLVNEVVVAITVYSGVQLLPKRLTSVCAVIGTMTLPIYIYHMPIVNLLLRSVTLDASVLIGFVRPLLVLAICSGVFYVLGLLAHRIHCLDWYMTLSGCSALTYQNKFDKL